MAHYRNDWIHKAKSKRLGYVQVSQEFMERSIIKSFPIIFKHIDILEIIEGDYDVYICYVEGKFLNEVKPGYLIPQYVITVTTLKGNIVKVDWTEENETP